MGKNNTLLFIHVPTFFLTIFITTIFLTIFIFLRLKIGLDCDMTPIKKKKLKECCKTGDLLVVAYGSKRAKLVKVFTGSMWTHCSVILRDGDEVNVMEVARYSPDETGIVISSIDHWLEKNSNCTIGYRPYLGRPIPRVDVEGFLEPRQDVKVDMNVVHWFRSMYKTRYVPQAKNRFYCSEFVCHFLQEQNVIKKKYGPAGYKPWELLYGDLPLEDEDAYFDPMLISDLQGK